LENCFSGFKNSSNTGQNLPPGLVSGVLSDLSRTRIDLLRQQLHVTGAFSQRNLSDAILSLGEVYRLI
jgi:hypothetical protein